MHPCVATAALNANALQARLSRWTGGDGGTCYGNVCRQSQPAPIRAILPAVLLLSVALHSVVGGIGSTTRPSNSAFVLRGAAGYHQRHGEVDDQTKLDDIKKEDEPTEEDKSLTFDGPFSETTSQHIFDSLVGEVVDGLLNIPLVELEVDDFPWRVAKVLVPLSPEVAKWWTELDSSDFAARLDGSLQGHPRLIIQIQGAKPLAVAGMEVPGVRTEIALPQDAVLHACHVGSVRVDADIASLVGLGSIRALLVVCPVHGAGIDSVTGANRALGGSRSVAEIARQAVSGNSPLRWLLLPWILLLMPFIVGSTMGPAALFGGACLTLASFASLSFIVAILIVTVHRRFAGFTRRWRRLIRLRTLSRRRVKVAACYGQNGPCCICLGSPSPQEALIALVPCRHCLHMECYSNWVRADSYPSHDLICPLCRKKVEAIGKIVT